MRLHYVSEAPAKGDSVRWWKRVRFFGRFPARAAITSAQNRGKASFLTRMRILPGLLKANWRQFGILASVAAAYFLASRLGFAIVFTDMRGAAVWPAAGFGLAALLLFGYRVWPGIFVGAFLSNLGLAHMGAASSTLAAALWGGLAIGSTLQSLVGARLVNRFAGGAAAFDEPKSVLLFVVLAGLLSTTISASLGVISLAAAGVLPWNHIEGAWFSWWLGDATGTFIITPVFLAWGAKRALTLTGARIAELTALLVLLVLFCGILFGDWLSGLYSASAAFFAIPILLWAAFRFGRRGTASTVLMVAALATVGTLHGLGPFALPNRTASLLLLQAFLAFFPIMAFIVAADAVRRREAEAGLRGSERRYRRLFEDNPQPMWVYDYQTLRFLAVNNAAIEHYGYSQEEFLNMRITDIRPAEELPALLAAVAKARSGQHLPTEWRHRKKDGTLIDVEITRHDLIFDGRHGSMVLSCDVTERKRAERRAAAFSHLGGRLSAARTEIEAAKILLDTADSLFGWDACTFEVCLEAEQKVATVLAIDTINGERRDVSSTPAGTRSEAETQLALEHGARRIIRPRAVNLPPDAVPFGDKTRETASLMYVPVRKDEKVLGVLSIQSYTPEAYTEDDLRTLQALADHCGGALERIRSEQEIARLNAGLEKRVRDRTSQLEALNRELEAFCYSVSHDLRAPLRSIRGFSDVLLERYAPQLDQRAQEFLLRTAESSAHMERLIEDLLKLSRVTRAELQRQPVNLSALAESIADDLRKSEPARNVEFVLAPDLQAVGDERLLRVALDNLLSNAWKFTSGRKNARVEFGITRQPEPAFFVRDNGAGFDMAYADKLFGVFQRLHTHTEFPGTGVGLATVQRILRRHEGRAWAEAAVNRGATFYFTLPGS